MPALLNAKGALSILLRVMR
jgi:hypothetical protein